MVVQTSTGAPSAANTADAPLPTPSAMPSIVRHAIRASIRLQSKLNERLQETLASQRDRSDLFAAWIIVLCSFAYGVLHALGPGHSRPAVELPRRERPERPMKQHSTSRIEWPLPG